MCCSGIRVFVCKDFRIGNGGEEPPIQGTGDRGAVSEGIQKASVVRVASYV